MCLSWEDGGSSKEQGAGVPLSPHEFKKEHVAPRTLLLPFPMVHLLSCPLLPSELTACGLSFCSKLATSFYSALCNVRADVNTLTHEKYVPRSFHLLAGRVRKITIITRNCTWVNGIASWPQGTESALVLEINRLCLLLFFSFNIFFSGWYLLPQIGGCSGS